MSEANPNDLDGVDSPTARVESASSSWEQLMLAPPNYLVIDSKMIISGVEGMLTASVTVSDFWSTERIACEVRPAMRYPQDLHLTLAWLEERVLHYSAGVSPF